MGLTQSTRGETALSHLFVDQRFSLSRPVPTIVAIGGAAVSPARHSRNFQAADSTSPQSNARAPASPTKHTPPAEPSLPPRGPTTGDPVLTPAHPSPPSCTAAPCADHPHEAPLQSPQGSLSSLPAESATHKQLQTSSIVSEPAPPPAELPAATRGQAALFAPLPSPASLPTPLFPLALPPETSRAPTPALSSQQPAASQASPLANEMLVPPTHACDGNNCAAVETSSQSDPPPSGPSAGQDQIDGLWESEANAV